MQCCVITTRRQKDLPPTPVSTPIAILPYYGTGPITNTYTEALIFALQYRGETPSQYGQFSLKSTTAEYLYYCYPAEYGPAIFVDRDNNMEGGWDGALMHLGQFGPAMVNVNVEGRGLVPFYLYRTEWPFNATTRWRVK